MSRGPGIDFEHQVTSSIPAGIWWQKVATPPPPVPGGRIAAYTLALLKKLAKECRGWPPSDVEIGEDKDGNLDLPKWIKAGLFSRFTASPGFDLLIMGPAPIDPAASSIFDALGRDLGIRPQALIGIAAELKSTDKASLPFDVVSGDQEKALAKAASGGLIAGVMIEWRGCRPQSRCCFIPIRRWLDIHLVASRKSLPVDEAFAQGIEIEADPFRGTARQYWEMGGFLSRCGMLVPEKERRGRGRNPTPAKTTEVPVARGLFE